MKPEDLPLLRTIKEQKTTESQHGLRSLTEIVHERLIAGGDITLLPPTMYPDSDAPADSDENVIRNSRA